MYYGALKALGPPGRSLSLECSLQGGASIINTTIPDQHSLRRASKTALSSMSCAVFPSRSKGSKQSRPRLMAANVTGCSLPENTSKNNFFEAECNGGSDELALASMCGLGVAPGPLWYEPRPAWATVKAAYGARHEARLLPDPVPAQDQGCFMCACCGPWQGAFAGSPDGAHMGETALVVSARLRTLCM